MQGILLLTRAEINRLRRNKRYLLFTVGLPVILYLIIGKQATRGRTACHSPRTTWSRWPPSARSAAR